MYFIYFLNKIKKHFFSSKLHGYEYIKTFKTKKFENFLIFSLQYTGYTRGAVVGGNSCRWENIQALLKMSECERRSTIASALKGYTCFSSVARSLKGIVQRILREVNNKLK
jgi:hypothetical protein